MTTLTTRLIAAAFGLATAGAAHAASVDLTFNNSNGFGVLVTPVYTGIHDGSFDAFDAGSPANAGVEQVAELPIPPNLDGNGNLLAPVRLAQQPDSQGGFIFGPGGPLLDGEFGTLTIDVADPTKNQFASFFAMFVPSNDTFLGNDNPWAYQIFDDSGAVIAQTIEITAAMIYDAGTEVNQLFGAAAPGQDILAGEDEGGVITRLLDIDDGMGGDGFDALGSLFGSSLGDVEADTVLFTIDVAATTPVPLPAGAPLLLAGLGAFALARKKRQA